MDLVFSCIIEEARDEVVATDPWFVICSIKAWQDQKKDNEYIDVASLAVKQYLNLSMPAVALLIISANTVLLRARLHQCTHCLSFGLATP